MMNTHGTDQTEAVAQMLGVGKGRSRWQRLRRYLMWMVLLVIVGAIGYYFMTRNAKETVAYETQPVERGGLTVTVSATGTLEPLKTVEVGIEVSGTVSTVEVDYNDQVEIGQVLARIDTSKLEAQVEQSEASLDSARANLLQAQATVREAEAQYKRYDEIRTASDGKLPSKTEMEAQEAAVARARADEASVKAAVAQAEATLEGIRSDLGKAVVHSPISGIVLERSVEPGQTVAASFQAPVLFTLAENLSQMELLVDVDEADVGQVQEGQEATFTVDAYPDRVFPAQASKVRYGSETVDGVVTYKTELVVDNSELILRPGMTATSTITVNKRDDVLLIPNAALRFAPPVAKTTEASEGGSLLDSIMPHPPREDAVPHDDLNAKDKEQDIWVLTNGQLNAIRVTKGLSDGRVTEIIDGPLEVGMQVVTDMKDVG